MKYKYLLFILSLGVCFTSCNSDELSRKKAAKIIQEYYIFPDVETEYLDLNYFNTSKYKELIQQGLLQEGYWIVNITNEGLKYVANADRKNSRFATNIREFNEVTGIVFDDEAKTKAKVEFSVRRTNITPFGVFKEYNEGDIVDLSVEFTKYDDGWRITTEKKNIFSVEDFDGIFEKELPRQEVSVEKEMNNSENLSENNNKSKTTIENKFLEDSYIGKIGNKDFKLFIENINGDRITGYNVTGTNKRPIKGKVVNKWTKKGTLGENQTVFKLILSEPGDDKWDGEFNIELTISDATRYGNGTWSSYNGKLNRNITIKDKYN